MNDYEYWYADVYECENRGIVDNIIVYNDLSQGGTVIPNRFYIAAGGPDGFVYQVRSEAPSDEIAFEISTTFGSFNSAVAACIA